MAVLPFPDRTAAGTQLAKELGKYGKQKNTIILSLVRGGVVTGRALADALSLPLYPYIVRKLGHPEDREYAMGALAEGGATFMDDSTMQMCGIGWEDMQPIIKEETEELRRRKKAYLVEARPPLEGKTIILTDDGAATGATLFAGIEDLKNAKVKKIVVALPVCPPDTAAKLGKQVDETVFLATPTPFHAVGLWYGDFPQVEDSEVLQLLSK
ncbi:MAG: Phosphoribosyltransferase [Candidatus Peregrinibacteria bacterium GW2011_GWA2_54_9]|nr:MAG: Phosphoribosyltransferase [Candidatus Peregrinibacteria bacterium GW2011_GWA2_54_9]